MATHARHRPSAAVLLVVLLVAACTNAAIRHPATDLGSRQPVVVASFNFDESKIVAEIYAQALAHAGVPVRLQLDLGPRELVWPALRQGMVDLVPEYLGTAAVTAAGLPEGQQRSRAKLLALLRHALARWHLVALRPSRASDQNGFAVTRATARADHLRTLSNLEPYAHRLVLGGPSECPRRPLCLLGLEQIYGLHFRRFVPFDDAAQRLAALNQHEIDVEVTFTTDGLLANGSLELLVDDRHLQPDESVLPVVSARAVHQYGQRLTHTLDAVSARLDTNALTFLNWRVGVAGKSPRAEAHGWLQRHGLLGPPR